MPTASVLDTAGFASRVVLPTLAGGVIKRRPPVLKAAELTHADRGAIAEVRRLRARYLSQPVRLRVPGRSFAVVLSERDVGRILADTPSPFSPASREKIGALAQFQPHGVLITAPDDDRAERRAVNEHALDTDRSLHRLADTVHAVVREEIGGILDGSLDWDTLNVAWWRAVRRITFGDAARDDERLTDQLAALRRTANWANLLPRRRALRAEFTTNLREHVDAAGDDSLAGQLRGGADPAGQVPHWLFAFDAAGIAIARTLAVLATHRKQRSTATEEIGDLDEPSELPYLRACVLDTVRLWPTTPMILRESDAPTTWDGEELPAGTTFVIFTPYFHRDADRLPFADSFAPRIWIDGTADDLPALVPFSAGPARCPGADLVLFATSTALATVLATHDVELTAPVDLDPNRPLPATLDNFSLRFATPARAKH
jgi:cytochrome P450